jgi:hypothetical protein
VQQHRASGSSTARPAAGPRTVQRDHGDCPPHCPSRSRPPSPAAARRSASPVREYGRRRNRLAPQQSPRDQRDLLYKGVIIGGGDRVGFTKTQVPWSKLPSEIQTRIQAHIDEEYQRVGETKYTRDEGPTASTVIRHAGETYGYRVDFTFSTRDDSGDYWSGSLLVGARGARLQRQGHVDGPDAD